MFHGVGVWGLGLCPQSRFPLFLFGGLAVRRCCLVTSSAPLLTRRYSNDAGRADVLARARDAYAVAHTRLQFLKDRFRESPNAHVVRASNTRCTHLRGVVRSVGV